VCAAESKHRHKPIALYLFYKTQIISHGGNASAGKEGEVGYEIIFGGTGWMNIFIK
jgi:hypothetical protein